MPVLVTRALTMTEKASLLWSIATYFEKNQDKIHHITGKYEVSPLHPCCPGAHLNFLFLQDKFVSGEVSDLWLPRRLEETFLCSWIGRGRLIHHS